MTVISNESSDWILVLAGLELWQFGEEAPLAQACVINVSTREVREQNVPLDANALVRAKARLKRIKDDDGGYGDVTPYLLTAKRSPRRLR